MKPIGDMTTVRAKLMLRGWRSLSAWAVAHGYLPVTARRAIYDWGQREERPLGGINRQIMASLRRTLAEDSEHEAA